MSTTQSPKSPQRIPSLVCSTLSALTLHVLTVAAFAQTWQTVDDFHYIGGAAATSVAVDPSGNIFVAGNGDRSTTNLVYNADIRKSSDGGATWAMVDDFTTPVDAFY